MTSVPLCTFATAEVPQLTVFQKVPQLELSLARGSNTRSSLGNVFCRAKTSKSDQVELITSVIENIFLKAVAYLCPQTRFGSCKNIIINRHNRLTRHMV